MTEAQSPRRVSRRLFAQLVGAGSLGALAACTTPAAAPTTAPAKPAATAVPAKPTAAAATKPAEKAASSPAAAPATQAPAAKAPPTPLKVVTGTPNGFYHAGALEIATRRGILREVGVEIDMQYTQGDVVNLQAIIANQYLTADMGPGTATNAIAGGSDIRLIATNNTKTHYGVFAHPSVKTVQELKGKPIGAAAVGSFPNQAIEAWLKTQNLQPSDYEVASIGPTPEVYKAIVAGKVMAGPAGADFIPAAKRDGLTILTEEMHKDVPGFFIFAFPARTSSITGGEREALVRTMAAWALINRLWYDPRNKDEFVEAWFAKSAKPKEDSAYLYDWAIKNRWWAANLEFTPDQVKYVQEVNVASPGGQKEVLPFDRAATMEVREEAVRRVGEYKYA